MERGREGEETTKNDLIFALALSRQEKKTKEKKNSIHFFRSLETPTTTKRETLRFHSSPTPTTMSAPDARGENAEMLAKWREVREQIAGAARERSGGEKRRGKEEEKEKKKKARGGS